MGEEKEKGKFVGSGVQNKIAEDPNSRGTRIKECPRIQGAESD
jgi:hypothetical protein